MTARDTGTPAGSDSTRARYERLVRRYAAQGRELERLTTELGEYKNQVAALKQFRSQVAELWSKLLEANTDNATLRSNNSKYYLENAKLLVENERCRAQLSDISITRFRPDVASPAEYTRVSARLATLSASNGGYSPRQLALITRGAECAVEQGRRLRYPPHPEIVLCALTGNSGGMTGLELTDRYALIAESYNHEWMMACGDISPDDDDGYDPIQAQIDARHAEYAASHGRTPA